MLALVFLWTLSPDKLETTPVWQGDSHSIGLQLKVHGRKWTRRTEEESLPRKWKVMRGTTPRTGPPSAGLTSATLGDKQPHPIKGQPFLRLVRRAAREQVANVKVYLANSGWDLQAAHTDARPHPRPRPRRLAAPRPHTLFYCGTAAWAHLYLSEEGS